MLCPSDKDMSTIQRTAADRSDASLTGYSPDCTVPRRTDGSLFWMDMLRQVCTPSMLLFLTCSKKRRVAFHLPRYMILDWIARNRLTRYLTVRVREPTFVLFIGSLVHVLHEVVVPSVLSICESLLPQDCLG